MRRSVLPFVVLISLSVPVGHVSAAGAQGFRSKDHTHQVVRVTRQRIYTPPRYTRRVYRPSSRYAGRVRPAHRRVVRPRSRTAVVADRPAQAVYYYDNTLVGRDPDANVRLMLLRDNSRTMWAR